MPHANPLIFKPTGGTDIAYVDCALILDHHIRLLAAGTSQSAMHRGGVWKLSSAGQTSATSLKEHVLWLLDVAIRPNIGSIRRLRNDGYWTSVIFHDYLPPESLERGWVDEELERLAVTFDFELERR